jgi:hypothetical protein
MRDDGLALSQRDRDRLKEIRSVLSGDIRQRVAAERLRLSVRQVKRLVAAVRRLGDKGIVHGLRGRASNRRVSEGHRAKAVQFLSRTEYRGFGPTLASEHLERRGIAVSRETVRHWMLGAGLWRSRPAKAERIHTWRERRSCFGDMVLMDTSEHRWLEKRGPVLYLIALIDDASSRLWARFVEHDSTQENLRTLGGWLERYGRPLALYTDKGSVFVTSRPEAQERNFGPPGPTSFNAALQELGIEWIAAHSPQAKGRVERLFGTLQDRLLKELRVAGAKTLADANRYLHEVFIPDWQGRFAVEPRSSIDAHRPIGQLDLASILSQREIRQVASDYTLSHAGRRWAIARPDVQVGLRKSKVVIETRLDGTRWVRFRKARLPLSEVRPAIAASGLRPPATIAKTRTGIGYVLNRPHADHPWRKPFKRQATK